MLDSRDTAARVTGNRRRTICEQALDLDPLYLFLSQQLALTY